MRKGINTAKNYLDMIVLIILIMLTLYQDSIGFIYIGEIGRIPVFFLLPFFVFSEILGHKVHMGAAVRQITSLFSLYIKVALILSVINTILFYIDTGDFYYLGEHVMVKSLKYIFYYVFFLVLFRAVYVVFMKLRKKPRLITRALIFIVIVHIFININEFINAPNAFTWLHNEKLYYRVRLMASEASWTSGIVIVLSTMILFFRKNKSALIVGVLFIGIYFATTTSKSFLLSSVISIFIVSLYSGKMKPIYGVFLIIFSFIVGYFVFPYLVSSFSNDLEDYTSTITRTTMFLSGLTLSIMRPMGSGGVYFYYLLQDFKETGYFVIHDIFKMGDLSEIASLGTGQSGDSNISAGSMLAEWGACLGIFGYYMFYRFVKILISISKVNTVLLTGSITCIILNAFTQSLMNRWEWAIFFAFIAYVHDHNVKKTIDNEKNSNR